ncbi:hypothetical protein BV898_17499 [Hypsibius exemplaris]|uniref:Uncharacterized protein n=1 Tax=Hypsibius exemplaris TaxID=2072580 RepID=A0A9X6NNQ7_HYPEX|nr:hypothetical protein BV898_17499 [Hypsibius exemplaris]
MKIFLISAVILAINAGAALGFLQGRATCTTYNRTASVTTSAFACSNCYRLTNAAANASCAATYCSKPTLVNTGTSSVVVPCSKVGDLVQGPQFIIPTPSTNYYVDVQVVSSSSQSAAGTTSYLSYNPITGYIQVGVAGPENIDVTQVYSVVLINRVTGAASNPVFFTAKIYTCTMYLVGPKSFSVCIGLGTPYLGGYTNVSYTACNNELLINGVNWDAVNPLTGTAIDPTGLGPGNSFCPFVTAFTGSGDLGQCYIFDRQTGNPEFFARGSQVSQCVFDRCVTPAGGVANTAANNPILYNQAQLDAIAASIGLPAALPASILTGGTIGPTLITPCDASSTFTQTITIDGTAPAFQTGVISGITVTYDSTCNTLGAFNITC